MAVVVLYEHRAGGYRLRFRYDPAVVATIKAVVPGYARAWNRESRYWKVEHDWWAVLRASLLTLGCELVDVNAGCYTESTTDTDGWAERLFRAVGPQRTPAVHRALTKILHPDNGRTGSAELQRQLNDARSLIEGGRHS
ncbi:hypothetical protein BMW24_022990 [Mycobacterium heckeshornense]|uniref:Uncharacterized protein n=1 Tax=Mycobacterium heckeshornense TaxID=110505 RepID=A0A2G8AVB2_9MYCO|nr:hypothetical protein [Mycobacterium heckeshornense]KMV23265.1 hypothetical protein ACT16_06130 [Mycobacterium heckeshornense]MCV7032857.1 hypothetical protein [Mycobacterium heckeshornense]PIJ29469.1 hypothetical protein BMW24_022990 [Mycobacterium heckeshornense]BCO35499.1 hypothetical protein MHEC_19320 [Mycobacterium heckeshornense]